MYAAISYIDIQMSYHGQMELLRCSNAHVTTATDTFE
jgi:hypothetical protein